MARWLWFATGILAMIIISGTAHSAVIEWPEASGGNDHFYELVEDSLNWDDANVGAQTRSFMGVSGHLVTIMSTEENQFLVDSFVLNHQWIGGFQLNKLDEPAGNWAWVTGEPFVYTNWGNLPPNNEPNESGVEDWIAFGSGTGIGGDLEGLWQDWKFFGDPPPNRPRGYLVEYEPAQGPVIPEPSSLLLLGTGLLGLVGWRRRFAR